jgi:hypothetical protein
MKISQALLAVVIGASALVAASPANATVRYTLETQTTFSLGRTIVTATFDTPTFITSDEFVATSDCRVEQPANVSCNSRHFFMPTRAGNDGIGLGLGLTSYNFFFADGALSAYGTYNTILFGSQQSARLTVSEVIPAAVPEPATWAMMLLGFGLVGAGLRRTNGTTVTA